MLTNITWAAATISLSQEIPRCHESTTRPLPGKYYDLAKTHKEFSWVRGVGKGVKTLEGRGFEGLPASNLYSSYSFTKVDLDGDGSCDWVLTYTSAGLSVVSKDVPFVNTFYFGIGGSWKRVGSTAAGSKYDASTAERKAQMDDPFAFFNSPPLFLYDVRSKVTYLIASVYDDRWIAHPSALNSGRLGYRIYVWNKLSNSLEDLDKWIPNSPAAAVYAYFKLNGAVNAHAISGTKQIEKFDSNIEKLELETLERECALSGNQLPISGGLMRACKTREFWADKRQ